MTSRIIVNNIQSDAGISTIFFNSDIGATSGTLNLAGNLNVSGVVTYEDVTNIDSVGVVTARSGLQVTGGSVGIGTDNPGDKLSISGGNLGIYNTGNNHGNVYFYKDGTAKGWLKYRGNDDKLVIGNVTDAINVQSNGTVGINSTTPHRHLVVGGGGDISCLGTNGGIYFGTSTGGFRNNGAIARAAQAGYHVSTSQVGDLVMAPEADKALILSSGGSSTMYERLRVTTGGNIGINDSGPNFHLDINGNIALREGQVLTWHDGSGNKAGDVYMDSSDNFVIRNTSSVTERFRIDSSGFITQKFTSNNSTTAEGLFINNLNNGTGNNASLILSNDSGERKKAAIALIDTGSYGAGDLVFALDGADSGELHLTNDEKLRITSAGDVKIKSFGNASNGSADALQIGKTDNNYGITILSATNAQGRIDFTDTEDTNDPQGKIAYYHDSNSLQFFTNGGAASNERLRITSTGSLLHKGNNSNTIDNTDGDGQSSSGYPAGGATFNKNISVNNNASAFGQCMNMISHTKSVTLNGSTNHNMVTIFNREGCFIGHVYAGYSTGGDGAVAMYKFNTFYSANSLIAELGPSSRSSDTISVSIDSVGDNHTFRVNGNGYSGVVTIGLVFLSAGNAGAAAHYGVRYY